MAFTIMDEAMGYPKIAATSTAPWTGGGTATPPLGSIVTAVDPVYGAGEFIFLKGVASTVVGSLVVYDQNLATTALAPATGGNGPVAVAMSANVANQFGWYQISGAAAVKAPNAMAPGADVFMLAATPGSVDDAAVAGEQVLNAKVSTTTGTPSAGLGIIQINRPFLQGQIT
jgi:hypothetical protein